MPTPSFDDLKAFVAVAREGSFTKAAARIGVSQSALSHTIRGLEERLGLRLLARTTRSVSPTDAGERLLRTLEPRFDEIEDELAALTDMIDRPAGTIRITAAEHAASTVLWPKLKEFLPRYPAIAVEVNVNNGFTDIVANRFDAGVRLGESIEKDMIAVRISPDVRMAAIAAPSYFERYSMPKTPQDLTGHNCLNLRLPTLGGLYAWEFNHAGRELAVRVDGQLTFNSSQYLLDAAVAGLGLAYVPADMAHRHINAGHLVPVLEDWCAVFAGYHLYYPISRQASPAFRLLVEALRCVQ